MEISAQLYLLVSRSCSLGGVATRLESVVYELLLPARTQYLARCFADLDAFAAAKINGS